MTSQFSPKVSEILAFSREEARRLSCSYVGPEHLLLAMMRMKEGPVFDIFYSERRNQIFPGDETSGSRRSASPY